MESSQKEQMLKDRAAVLAIAYHNMGVELEYLKRVAIDYAITLSLTLPSLMNQSERIEEQ